MREWHMQYIPEEKYDKLHQANLGPLDIKIPFRFIERMFSADSFGEIATA